MNKVRKGKGISMLVVGMVIGAFAFGAVAANAAKKYEERPFSGVLEGTTDSAPITDMGPDQGEIASSSAGTINATHIGEGTYTLVAQQDYDRHEEEEHVVGNCAFVEDGMDADGTPGFVITAANGDTINGFIDDDRSVTCAPDSQTGGPAIGDEYYSTLYIRVDGGTGRFSDASGWLFAEGTSTLTGFNPMTGEAQATDEALVLGDIDY